MKNTKQINISDLEKIIMESTKKVLNENSVYYGRNVWPAANIEPYGNRSLVTTNPAPNNALVRVSQGAGRTGQRAAAGRAARAAQNISTYRGPIEVKPINPAPTTVKGLIGPGTSAAPKATAAKGVGRALANAGKAVGAFATSPAGIVTLVAAAVAAGTMIYLNRRNKNGLEALKSGMWDGHYPWEDQEIKIAMPNPGSPRGTGKPPVSPAPQPTNQPPTSTVKRDTTALPNLSNGTAGAVIRNSQAGEMPQMRTQTNIGVPSAQARSTVNNPRIAQMQKNGRSPEAIGNAAARQQGRTLRRQGPAE